MTQVFPALNHDTLRITFEQESDVFRMNWCGQSEIRTPSEFLTPYLKKIPSFFANRNLVVDFRKLEYMSSATAAPVIQFLNLLNTNKVQCTVIYSGRFEWQKVSCRCMTVVCKNMKYVKITID